MTTNMTLWQFLLYQLKELYVYQRTWRRFKREGDPDFGAETTLEDWQGSLDAYRRLHELFESVAPRLTNSRGGSADGGAG